MSDGDPSQLRITSPAFTDNTAIPVKYTCRGENSNPALNFLGIPENAKSLALIVHDPDALRGDWVHWTVWDIDPSITTIPEATASTGAREGITDFGKPGYGGPCPPSGTHRYLFDLYALDTPLALPSTTARDELLAAMEGHIVGTARLTGLVSGGNNT